MRYDENFNCFSSHTEWYEFVIGVGYVPNDLATIQATIAMVEYNSYTFGKEHWLYEKRKISEKVKFLLENEHPKKEVVMIALGENGFDKIDEMVELEKEIRRLREESDKLTEWPECNES